MEEFNIKFIKQQNPLCQWYELYKGNKYYGRFLMGNNPTIKDIVNEFYNSSHISKMESQS